MPVSGMDGDGFRRPTPRELEHRKLATMTFAERKAYRISKRPTARRLPHGDSK